MAACSGGKGSELRVSLPLKHIYIREYLSQPFVRNLCCCDEEALETHIGRYVFLYSCFPCYLSWLQWAELKTNETALLILGA